MLAQPPAHAQQALLELSSYPQGTLQILAADGGRHTFRIWIADTPARQMQGLMFVRDLPAEQGMLFVHREPLVASMWMKNTFIPLDMLFIDARGRVVSIAESTTPHSLDTISAGRPVTGVLELRGGEVARRGIRRGDRVLHQHFQRGQQRRDRRADSPVIDIDRSRGRSVAATTDRTSAGAGLGRVSSAQLMRAVPTRNIKKNWRSVHEESLLSGPGGGRHAA
jgi:hypothetical protein